jgi:hypothetical protein
MAIHKKPIDRGPREKPVKLLTAKWFRKVAAATIVRR